ncbi:hypothetical protein RIF29_16027 [Crotalaria pallida]|uniref:Uncharacterized protein n=1 Tax=Crotalaria pallida TaxID=3830 RepID=A0AAN9FGH8_CROPI
MKSTFSSTIAIILILLFHFFFSSSNCHALPPSNPSQNTLHHLHYCDSFSRRNTRSLCIELQRMHHVPVPPPSKENGIDHRFGAEKRLLSREHGWGLGGEGQEDPMSFINMEPPKDKDVSIYGCCFVSGVTLSQDAWAHS